jgi:hypothetical protein
MKLILIKIAQLNLLISKFKNLIQPWKVWEKHQNNKFGYGIQAFPKTNVVVPYFPKLNFLLSSYSYVFQKWYFKNNPMINSN